VTALTEAQVRESLRTWIKERAATRIDGDFSDQTPLVASRLLTSMQVTELLLHIEELSGEPLDVGQLRPGAFRDIDAIYATFFAAGR
jgi:hypothetical protein